MPPHTFSIGRKAGASLLHSARTAAAIGRPLNVFVTINFWQFDHTADTIFHAFADLREQWFTRWSAYAPRGSSGPRNGTPTYAYVHEANHDLPHTHWMVHIDAMQQADFEQKLSQWLQRRYGLAALPSGALHVTEIDNPEGLKLYLAKGIDPYLGQLWRITPEDCGRIGHRRADTSRNLGPAAWRPLKAQQMRRAA